MKYKICVYAICKNELQFVERWYNSMCEADHICVLDTGSSDGTLQKLKSLGVYTEQRIINTWRFDTARNLSMEMIPYDTDICVCTDLDEVFEPGWREKLEKYWDDKTTSATYKYVWSFDKHGRESIVFNAQKIHSRFGFKWVHPVHEVLEYTGSLPQKNIFIPEITLNHRPDPQKSRAQYLPLLELSVEEDPNDDRNLHYLGREYMFYGMWDKSIETLKKHLSMPNATWKCERCASMRYIAECYRKKGDINSAFKWLYKAISESPDLREPYIEFAELCVETENWEGVVFMCESALKITLREINYLSDSAVWGALPYDLLSLGYFYTDRYTKALNAVRIAVKLAPDDERIRQNLDIISEKTNFHNN